MQKYNTEMGKAEKNTRDLGKSSNNLATAISGLFTVALAQRIAAVGGEMVQLGMEANQTEARFRALTSTMGSYDATMQGLRDATLGVVDDMHLQAGAMLLVQTANIETNEELEKFMNLITMTKKPSEDMTAAIQNFGLMLANNSILRLDSFGISASKVRARIEELKEELGVDRSEAFRMAVLEEGAKNIEKFGDAADAAGTAISRLDTVLQNAFQDISQRVATGAEGLAGLLEIALGTSPHLANREANTQSMVNDLTRMAMELLPNETDISAVPPNFLESYLHAAVDVAIRSPKLAEDKDRLREAAFALMNPEDKVLFPGTSQEAFDSITTSMATMAQYVGRNSIGLMEQLETEREIAAEAERIAEIRAGGLDTESAYIDFYERGTRALHQSNLEQERAAERRNAIRSTMMSSLSVPGQDAFDAAFQYNGQSFGNTGVPEYMTQEQADAVAEAAAQARMLADNIAAVSEAESDLFSEEEVERVDQYATRLEDMAGAAQDAATAFQNMSLDELLGRDGGGRLGEELDVVLEKMKALGAEAYQIQNASDAFDLASGRETWMGKAFEDQIATNLAQSIMGGGMTEHMAAAILREFDTVMANAKLQGIDMNNPQFQSMVTSTFTNPLFNPDTFNPDEFLAGFQPAADAASTISTDSATATENFTLISEKTPIIAENMGLVESSLGGAVTHTDKLKTNLDDMSSKKYVVQIEPQFVNIPALVLQLFPALFQAFSQQVQGAGGTMQGTSPRASLAGPQ